MKKPIFILLCAMALSWPMTASAERVAGDANNDGVVNIADVTTVIDCLLSSSETVESRYCDVDGDGMVSIADVSYLLDKLLTPTTPQYQDVTFTINGVQFTMVFVEGGTFQMGCTPDQWPGVFRNEGPVHEVTLWSYYIAQTEVTQELWEAVMGYNPSKYVGYPQRPVENVSVFDCALFVDKLSEITGRSFRLPTEAEWEYAARGGNKTLSYRFSGSGNIDDVAWYDENSDGTTHAVASKLANELGIYDMSGNVNEWCQDWYSGYTDEPVTNPVGPESGYENVFRGGSWGFPDCKCRNSFRDEAEPHTANTHFGLRVAMNI